MEYISLLAVLLFAYPFTLENLRTGKINKQQLVLMLSILVAFFPYYVREWWQVFPAQEFGKYWAMAFVMAAALFALLYRNTLVRPEFWWTSPVMNKRENLLRFVAFVAMSLSFLLIAMNV